MSAKKKAAGRRAASLKRGKQPAGVAAPAGAQWPATQLEMRELKRLVPYARNARVHAASQVAKIAASIREFGWTVQVLIDEKDGLIAGHGRVLAAEALGIEHVPVVVARGWSEAQRRAYVIADNKLALDATWDEGLLRIELEDLMRLDFDLSLTGFDSLDGVRIGGGAAALEDDGASVPPVPKVPASRTGDLWVMGDHRLLCGDSLRQEDMARLMDGQVAHLLATDPPYLVDYDGTNHPAEHHKKAGRASKDPAKEVGNKHWDEYKDPTASVEFFELFLRVALPFCIERVPIYQWHATRRQVLVEDAWKRNGLLVHQTIIWTKTRGVLTRSMYLWQHEPCFFGWKQGSMPEKGRRPPANETTVWAIAQSGEDNPEHPTPKPLEIFGRPLQYHTRKGEIALEPFSGSGSQIVAAEKLGRRCFAMEKEPGFVDVAVLRWQGHSGADAVLDGDGRTFADVSKERAKR